jgi:hypothetical protein
VRELLARARRVPRPNWVDSWTSTASPFISLTCGPHLSSLSFGQKSRRERTRATDFSPLNSPLLPCPFRHQRRLQIAHHLLLPSPLFPELEKPPGRQISSTESTTTTTVFASIWHPRKVALPLLGLCFFPRSGAPSDIFIYSNFIADRARHQGPKCASACTTSGRLSAPLLDTTDDVDHTLELTVTSHILSAPSLLPGTLESLPLTTTRMQRCRFLHL